MTNQMWHSDLFNHFNSFCHFIQFCQSIRFCHSNHDLFIQINLVTEIIIAIVGWLVVSLKSMMLYSTHFWHLNIFCHSKVKSILFSILKIKLDSQIYFSIKSFYNHLILPINSSVSLNQIKSINFITQITQSNQFNQFYRSIKSYNFVVELNMIKSKMKLET